MFLRAPGQDWPAIKRGYKTEFRLTGSALTSIQDHLPTPVVLYSERGGRYDKVVAVMEKVWREPLGAISPESLGREGFTSMPFFRRYWMDRVKARFRPLDMVTVYRFRILKAEDIDMMAHGLLVRLYGDFLEDHHGAG